MKQKRKYHEISEDENNSSIKTLVDSNANKRIKISQIAALPNFDPEEDEVWLVRLPNHLNPDELHNKEVFSFKNYWLDTSQFHTSAKIYYMHRMYDWNLVYICTFFISFFRILLSHCNYFLCCLDDFTA